MSESAGLIHRAAEQPPIALTSASRHPIVLVIVASSLAWAILLIAVPPSQQNFPLGDDWAFSRSLFALLDGKGIHYFRWASMPEWGQWLWAAPVAAAFPHNHVALRISTIIAGFLALGALYSLMRGRGICATRAAWAAAALAFNPLFFLLQGTFMTDVPALAFSLVALALYARAVVHDCIGLWWLGCMVAVGATATRQNTVAVPLVALALLWRAPHLRRHPWWLIGGLLPLFVALLCHGWLRSRNDIIDPNLVALPPEPLVLLPFLILHFCGLSALPLLLDGQMRGVTRKFALALLIMVISAGYWSVKQPYLPYGPLFPYCPGIFGPWGPFAGSLVVGNGLVVLGPVLRWSATILGCLGGAMLLDRLSEWRFAALGEDPLLLFTLLQIPALIMTPVVFDRYLLFLLPGLLYLTVMHKPQMPPRQAVPAIGIALLGLLSIAMMHDWLAWNSARWALGERAMMHGTDPADIEGGMEWDGWYAPEVPLPPTKKPPLFRLPFTRDRFPHVNGRLALSFQAYRGTTILDQQAYRSWLVPGEHEFYLLALPAGAGAATPALVPQGGGDSSRSRPPQGPSPGSN